MGGSPAIVYRDEHRDFAMGMERSIGTNKYVGWIHHYSIVSSTRYHITSEKGGWIHAQNFDLNDDARDMWRMYAT